MGQSTRLGSRQPQALYIPEVRSLILRQRYLCVDVDNNFLLYYQWADVANVVHSVSYTMLAMTQCCSKGYVPSRLDFEVCCILLFVQLFASRALSFCKHDMGNSFVVKCGTTQKSTYPPLWQTVRCSAHGH